MNIGYIHFKVAGTDGVSLEMAHWKQILESMGHTVTYIAGELDTDGIVIPELHFTFPKVLELHEKLVSGAPLSVLSADIYALADLIESKLRTIFVENKFDKLILSNVFSIPMNISFTIALYRVVMDLNIPIVAKHCDFWWERERYINDSFLPVFDKYFPPVLPNMEHIVINKLAQKALFDRKGIKALITHDCFDFEHIPATFDEYNQNFRPDFGISLSDKIILSATRLVPRKNIELTIELVKKLQDPRVLLVLAGYGGDEGHEYETKLKALVQQAGIRAIFIGSKVLSSRKVIGDTRYYSLWDCYVNCDFVAYTTVLEGFGNQFVEAIAFKKPILVNRYSVYKSDIEPLGFKTVAVDEKLTDKSITDVKTILYTPSIAHDLGEYNFEIGKKHFSYDVIAKKLASLGF